MIRRKKRLPKINTKKLLEYSIEELLNEDYDLLRYRILAYERLLRREERILEDRIKQLSEESGKHYSEDHGEDLNKRLKSIKRDIEALQKISTILVILNTIREIKRDILDKSVEDKELRDKNKELWDNIKKIRLKDMLSFRGDPDDKLTVYNFLISIVKGVELPPLPPEPERKQTEVEKPLKKEPETPNLFVINERDYVGMEVEGWINLLNKCFAEGKILELPEKYLEGSMRRPLRNLIVAMLEIPPERLKYILPKKYKYLHIIHNILYVILRENRVYTARPGASDLAYIDGEGGIFDIFQARVEGEEMFDNIKKKIYRIKIGERDYMIVKEIVLEKESGRERAKEIRYKSMS